MYVSCMHTSGNTWFSKSLLQASHACICSCVFIHGHAYWIAMYVWAIWAQTSRAPAAGGDVPEQAGGTPTLPTWLTAASPPAPVRTGNGSAQMSRAWPPAPSTGTATTSPSTASVTASAGTASTHCCRWGQAGTSQTGDGTGQTRDRADPRMGQTQGQDRLWMDRPRDWTDPRQGQASIALRRPLSPGPLWQREQQLPGYPACGHRERALRHHWHHLLQGHQALPGGEWAAGMPNPHPLPQAPVALCPCRSPEPLSS